ncbi:TPA: hypothetical protein JI303_19940, partial [Acinetobacter baumannii]|nr:hypothetical protein [Acinetobacter baumannii]
MDKKALLEQFKAEVEASGTSLTHILKMCEFDEVSNDFRSDTIHDYSIGCLNGAWWMFQRQQAKVEELQALYTQQGINMLKMQKRVDAAELKLKEITNIAMRARRGEYYTESGRNAGLNIAAQL